MNKYRPSALQVNVTDKDTIEDSVYKQEFTTGFHIILSVALACLAWVLMIKPIFMNVDNNKMKIITVLFWAVIFPITILATGVLLDSIMSKSNIVFIYLKYITIWITMIVVLMITMVYGNNKIIPRIAKYSIIGLTFINILEAVLDQSQAIAKMFQAINKTNDEAKIQYNLNDLSNILNTVVGAIIAILFVYEGFKQDGLFINDVNGMKILNYNLGYALIFAYTFWNLHFRSYLLRNTSTFLFLVVSLVLPLISNYYFKGSWFQVRVLTLFFYISIVLGFSKDDSRFLPFYNEQGYIEKPDSSNMLASVQTTEAYKWLLIALSIFSLLCYFMPSRFIPSQLKNISA